MKKQLIALIIGVTIAFAGISQTSKPDTTCIPNAKLREAISKIEEGKIAKEEVKLLKEQILNYESRIKVKDSIQSVTDAQIGSYADMTKNFDLYVANLKKQNELITLAHQSTLRELKKEKGKKWIMTGAFIASILTTAYFYGK